MRHRSYTAHVWSTVTNQCMYFVSWRIKDLEEIQQTFIEHPFWARQPAKHKRGIHPNQPSLSLSSFSRHFPLPSMCTLTGMRRALDLLGMES